MDNMMIFDTDDPDFLECNELNERRNKKVKVLRKATKEDADIDILGDMYEVEWEDGYTNFAMEWELTPIQEGAHNDTCNY